MIQFEKNSAVTAELRWRPVSRMPRVSRPFGKPAPAVDCDLTAIVCGADGRMVQGVNGQVPSFGGNAVIHGGDDLTGEHGGEKIGIDLARLPASACKIVLAMHISNAALSGQHLGMLCGAVIQLTDAVGTACYRLELSGQFRSMEGLLIGEFRREPSGWVFAPLAQPLEEAGVVQNLYRLYM